ncbi:hypothetical protein AKN87_08340 [Thiopseudomonas alkaliphila]|uniref:Uncharacterized protein n=1 Tax=Thiopseudomonas alkaliphila TaxID=1697053 RepID=A0A0K1XE26_9GAMM|nr:hypothetical protein AKN87_08340 [Thiopseudomonas alkaliphila]AKX51189.1 hypothetical protein AKN92_06530 [Thiopseudomonas alkaliphila]AKX57546.1 hypothetical protein AKN89_06730 [Thiopseudomonas alkaliphila]AKX59514.1 hypothetical protein AKN88_05880 [Thiopseudomonas alkaliphila]
MKTCLQALHPRGDSQLAVNDGFPRRSQHLENIELNEVFLISHIMNPFIICQKLKRQAANIKFIIIEFMFLLMTYPVSSQL